MDAGGTVVSNPNLIEEAFISYFSNIFTSTGSRDCDSIYDALNFSLSVEALDFLDRTFVADDI